jgi:hypothetical protein
VDRTPIAAATAFVRGSTAAARETTRAETAGRFNRLRRDLLDPSEKPNWLGWTEASLALDPDGGSHRHRLAKILSELACDADGAPYVARGLIGRPNFNHPGRLTALGDQLGSVREHLRVGREKPDSCKGVVGFTEED